MKWRSLEESSPEIDVRPLRAILAERKELIAKYVPAETQAVHARAVAELKQRRLAANILPVGAKVPEFQLQDHDGKSVSSSDLLAKGRLALCFIRGRWCPFCVAQMEAMNLVLPEIEQGGAQFGLTYRIPDEQKALYQRAFVNLPFVNGDDSWDLPIPSTYIIDRDGTMLYASANEDYTERPEPEDVVRFLFGSTTFPRASS